MGVLRGTGGAWVFFGFTFCLSELLGSRIKQVFSSALSKENMPELVDLWFAWGLHALYSDASMVRSGMITDMYAFLVPRSVFNFLLLLFMRSEGDGCMLLMFQIFRTESRPLIFHILFQIAISESVEVLLW